MKFFSAATALLVLTLGAPPAVEARGTRRTTRRAQEQADVAATPEDDLVTVDAPGNNGIGGNYCDCAKEEIRGIVHLTVPEAPEPCCDIEELIGERPTMGGKETSEAYYDWCDKLEQHLYQSTPSTGSLMIISDKRNKVYFKSANGIDVDQCMETDEKDPITQRLITYWSCPLIPGSTLTLEVTTTAYDDGHSCGCRRDRLLGDEDDVDGRLLGDNCGCDCYNNPYVVAKDQDEPGIVVAANVNYDAFMQIMDNQGCYDLRRRLESGENTQRQLDHIPPPTSTYRPGVSVTLQCGSYDCNEDHGYKREGELFDNEFIWSPWHNNNRDPLSYYNACMYYGNSVRFIDIAGCEIEGYCCDGIQTDCDR